MLSRVIRHLLITLVFSTSSVATFAENRIDTQRPDAPAMAAYGQYAIGVQTVEVINAQQVDIVNIDPAKAKPLTLPLYDRPLTLEIWYPATEDSQGERTLEVFLRDGKTKVAIQGKAIRDAEPITAQGKFPLVIISHGYPGNRFLLSHLAENVASKGYVVVSIDHTDSTYSTQAAFGSTLVNRPLDQLFTLNHIESMANKAGSFLAGLVDTQNTALIGYSMGGYGALITAGGKVTQQAVDYQWGAAHKTLAIHQHKDKNTPQVDPRFKAMIAFAPWGMNHGVWDKSTLKGVQVPTLFVAGSVDDVSGYEQGIRKIWQQVKNIDRALLTFNNANHSAGAPMPAPEESFVYDQTLDIFLSDHYTDAVWDTVRMNNVSQHFVTLWLEKYLKNNDDVNEYLTLITNSNDGVWSKDAQGQPKADHSHWAGFKNRTAKGLKFEQLSKGQ